MSEITEKVFNLEEALESLTTLVKTYSSDIYIPSKCETIKVNEITASQHKELLSSAIDNSLYSTNFNKVFFKILTDLVDPEYLKGLTIYDKASLAIGIRKQISDSVKINIQGSETRKIDISLSPVIEKFRAYTHPDTETFGNKNLSVSIGIPTIVLENLYETEMHKRDKTVDDIKTTNDIKDVVSKEFLGELSKYIQNVKLGEVFINFNNLKFPQKISVVEKLPSSLVQEVLTQITQWKQDLDGVLTIHYIDDKFGVERAEVIKIDPLLFVN